MSCSGWQLAELVLALARMLALHAETCELSLDYAWAHAAADAALLLALLLAARGGRGGKPEQLRALRSALRSAHLFGLVALLFDYCVFYLARGTRTLTLQPAPLVERADAPGPLAALLFFLWYVGGRVLTRAQQPRVPPLKLAHCSAEQG